MNDDQNAPERTKKISWAKCYRELALHAIKKRGKQ